MFSLSLLYNISPPLPLFPSLRNVSLYLSLSTSLRVQHMAVLAGSVAITCGLPSRIS